MKKDFLDSLNVKSPCQESWDEMIGNEQVRFCSHCAKDVHDLSSMTRTQAEKLVKRANGNLCVRYVKTPQGKLITAPPKFTQIKRRMRVAAGVFAASLALSTIAYSQQSESAERQVNWTQTVKKLSETGETNKDFSTITGTVMDAFGAVVPGAKVNLRSLNDQKTYFTATNENGVYEFSRVEPDVYEIKIESPGFKSFVVTDIVVAVNEMLEQSAILEAPALMGDVVIIEDPQAAPETEINPGVQQEKILELPRGTQTFKTMGMVAFARPEEKPKPENPKKTKKKKN